MTKSWKIALPLLALVLVPGYAAVQAAAETDTLMPRGTARIG